MKTFGKCVCMGRLDLSVSCTGYLLGRPCPDWQPEEEEAAPSEDR